MASEECNGHRCNKRVDKEHSWKATKAAHFRGFCVSLITHHTRHHWHTTRPAGRWRARLEETNLARVSEINRLLL